MKHNVTAWKVLCVLGMLEDMLEVVTVSEDLFEIEEIIDEEMNYEAD